MALDHVCSECKSFTEGRNMLRKQGIYICRECYHKTHKCNGCDKDFNILHAIEDFDSITMLCDGCYLKYNNLPLTNFSLN